MNITVPRKILNAFRKECRKAFPVEHVGALHGVRGENGDVLITNIVPIVGATSTEDAVNYNQNHVRRSKMKALRKSQDWLGTIHSHCFTKEVVTCPHPSPTDIKTAISDGEVVMGIVYVCDEGRESSVFWYVPSPLPTVQVV